MPLSALTSRFLNRERGPRELFQHERAFNAALRKSNGKAVVLVHPFYSEFDMQRMDYYMQSVRKMLKSTKSPVIIFEDHPNVASTHARLRELSGKNLFFVPMHADNVKPLAGWEKFHALVEKSKMKSALMGGMWVGPASGLEGEAEAIRAYEKSQGLQPLVSDPQRSMSGACLGTVYSALVLRARQTEAKRKIRIVPTLSIFSGTYSPPKPKRLKE